MSENTNNELRCKICGKLASEDCHFYPNQLLCNRHYLQIHIHGEVTDSSYIETTKREYWTDEEVKTLTELYKKQLPISEICEIMGKSKGSISDKAATLGLTKEIIRKNNANFKAIYQDYDWCYQKYFIERKSYEEMAEEAGASKRVIVKWCSEIHGLNSKYIKENLQLTDIQRQFIMFSKLGDGHISKRENEPIFIVSHAENQKDYLFWKYELLKDLCNKEPSYITDVKIGFTDKEYHCQNVHRVGTKVLNCLIPIRAMSKYDIIKELNEFGLAIHMLDDASRSDGYWCLCYAAFTDEEKQLYREILQSKFGITPSIHKDERYLGFNKENSRKIDEIILRNIPNDLDIVQYKILNDNKKGA